MAKRKNTAAGVLSRNLRRVLADRNLTAKEGAFLAQVPVSTFSAWVNGSALPMDLVALHRFATVAGVSFSWLCTGFEETALSFEDCLEDVPGEPPLSGIYRIEARRVRVRRAREIK